MFPTMKFQWLLFALLDCLLSFFCNPLPTDLETKSADYELEFSDAVYSMNN